MKKAHIWNFLSVDLIEGINLKKTTSETKYSHHKTRGKVWLCPNFVLSNFWKDCWESSFIIALHKALVELIKTQFVTQPTYKIASVRATYTLWRCSVWRPLDHSLKSKSEARWRRSDTHLLILMILNSQTSSSEKKSTNCTAKHNTN